MSTTLRELCEFIDELELADERLDKIEKEEGGAQVRQSELVHGNASSGDEEEEDDDDEGGSDGTTDNDFRTREQVELVLRKTMRVVFPIATEVCRGNNGSGASREGARTVIDASFVHFYKKTSALLKKSKPSNPVCIPWYVQSTKPRMLWMNILYQLIKSKLDLYKNFKNVFFVRSGNRLPTGLDLSSSTTLVITDDLNEFGCLSDPKCCVGIVGLCKLNRMSKGEQLLYTACSFTPLKDCYWSEKLLPSRDAFKHLVKLTDHYKEKEHAKLLHFDDDLFDYVGGHLDWLTFYLDENFICAHGNVVRHLEPGMRPTIDMLNQFAEKVRFCNMKADSIPEDIGSWVILSRPFQEDLEDGQRRVDQLPVMSLQNLRPDCLPDPNRSLLAVSQDHQSENVLAVDNLCFPSVFAFRYSQKVIERLILDQAPSGIYTIGGQFIVSNACKVFYALVETHRLANQTKGLVPKQRRMHLTGIPGTGKTIILLICACAWLLQPEKYRVLYVASPSFCLHNEISYMEQLRMQMTFAFCGDAIVSQIMNANFYDPETYRLIDGYLGMKNLVLVVIFDNLDEVDRQNKRDLFSWFLFVEDSLSKCKNIFLITAGGAESDAWSLHSLYDATRIGILNGFNEKEAEAVARMFDPAGSQTDFAIANLGYRPLDVDFRVKGYLPQIPDRNAPNQLSRESILYRLVGISSLTYNKTHHFIATSRCYLHKMRPVTIVANFDCIYLYDCTLLSAMDKRYMVHVHVPKRTMHKDQFKIDSLYEYEKLLSQVDFRKDLMLSGIMSTIVPCSKIAWSAVFRFYAEHVKKENDNLKHFYNAHLINRGPLESVFFFEMQSYSFDDTATSRSKVLKTYDVKTVSEGDNQVSLVKKGAYRDMTRIHLGSLKGYEQPVCVMRMGPDLEKLRVNERIDKLNIGSGIIQCRPFLKNVDFVIVDRADQIFLVKVGCLAGERARAKCANWP